jgi:pyridoxal biosynthesis lyase PdxS
MGGGGNQFKSMSTYKQAKSVIVYLHKEANVEMIGEIR